MKLSRAIIGFALVTLFYLGMLIWADSQKQVFEKTSSLWPLILMLAIVAFLSFIVRYCRWYWLLRRAGHSLNFMSGFPAYLAGFAFTATPGKVGELIRIRYFSPLGVPPWQVLAAFVYERAFDLICVLIFATFSISRADIFILVAGFVCVFVSSVIVVAHHPAWLMRLSIQLRMWRLMRISRMVKTLRDGLKGCRFWFNPLDVAVALGFGLFTWGISALSFALLLGQLGIMLPPLVAVSTYSLAMLAGAASMVPGGIGSTEAAIVALLSLHDVTFADGMRAAVAMRLSTLWFSILCGLVSLGMLEVRRTGVVQQI